MSICLHLGAPFHGHYICRVVDQGIDLSRHCMQRSPNPCAAQARAHDQKIALIKSWSWCTGSSPLGLPLQKDVADAPQAVELWLGTAVSPAVCEVGILLIPIRHIFGKTGSCVLCTVVKEPSKFSGVNMCEMDLMQDLPLNHYPKSFLFCQPEQCLSSYLGLGSTLIEGEALKVSAVLFPEIDPLCQRGSPKS
eukprot:365627-Pelagomonas_calceolata.AAC.4